LERSPSKKKSPTEICRAIEKDWGDINNDLPPIDKKPIDRWNGNPPE